MTSNNSLNYQKNNSIMEYAYSNYDNQNQIQGKINQGLSQQNIERRNVGFQNLNSQQPNTLFWKTPNKLHSDIEKIQEYVIPTPSELSSSEYK